jgi:hypothetical protein
MPASKADAASWQTTSQTAKRNYECVILCASQKRAAEQQRAENRDQRSETNHRYQRAECRCKIAERREHTHRTESAHRKQESFLYR